MYIVLSYSNNLILRYPSAANTFDVGNGHVAHHLPGNITHCAISVKGLTRCATLIWHYKWRYALLDQDAIPEDGRSCSR